MDRSIVGLGLLVCSSGAFALVGPPELHCASVEVNGDVTLTWTIPADPNNEFAQYEIFHSSVIGGPYNSIGTVAVYAQTAFLHAAAGGNISQQFYYVNTVSNIPAPNVSVNTQTLGTLYLTLNQSTPLGSALLDWTVQHTPAITGAAADFEVEMEYPAGTWNSIGAIPNDSSFFREVIAVCDDSLTFRVSLMHSSGCISYSNLVGDQFADVTPPSSPVLVTATVDTLTGLVDLIWAASPEPDTQGYIVVYVTQTGGIVIDTVYGVANTTYTDLNSNASSFSQSYTIAAFDTCWTGIPPSPNTSATLPGHSTVHLEVDYDRCNELMHLDWNSYVGWDSLVSYEVYRKQNGNAPLLITTLPAGSSSFTDAFVLPFNTYCYLIKAIGSELGQTSLSNFACRLTDYPALPQFNYLRLATVQGPDHVVILDHVDTSAAVKRYRLERAQNDGPWLQIDSKAPNGTATIRFDDLDANTANVSNRYRMQVVDSCDNASITSNVATSILLRADPSLHGYNRVVWNGYSNWNGPVMGYTLYRQDDSGLFTQLATLGPTQWSYDDNVTDLISSTGKFCYFVEAFEGSNAYGLDTISVSNFACAVQQQQFWVPNAFVQDGINNTFGPVTANVDLSNYEFGIISRWGSVIWSTNDPNEKWDGKVKDKYVPLGVYGYYFTYVDGRGQKSEARGTVTFIR